jgi:site-specific recombinase XerD
MTTTTREYFGGKAPKALPWSPLPHMEEYLENLALDGKEAYAHVAKLGLSHFAAFCVTEGVKHPEEIERHHILRFQAYLTKVTKENGELLSLGYRQQLMKYVRAWINWLQGLEYITSNPWVRIRIGQTVKKPKPLEDDEITALFDAHRKMAFAISPFFYHRREVILTLLYGWGLRVHELTSLTVATMDMRQDFITARNKGGGTKVLPYADEMKQIVQRWLLVRAKNAVAGEDALLIDSHGKALSPAMVYKIVTELGQRAGVTINPHRLRDSFGTKLLESDVPVERIMKMMGHTQRAQTLAYARVNDHTLKASHDAVMNPLIHKLLGGSL